MPAPIQTPDASQGLEQEFGLRGKVNLALDEIVVPVRDVSDGAGSSPWIRRKTCADAQRVIAAGAGTFVFYAIRPGAGTVLVVEAITWLVGGTTMLMKLFRPVDLAAVTTTATGAVAQTNGIIRSTGFLPSVACNAILGHHTTTTIGAAIHQMNWTAGQTQLWEFKRGITLDGRDPAGASALVIMIGAANVEFTAGFFGTEYTGKGNRPIP